MNNFTQFKLPEALNQALAKLNFTQPTPIQSQAIPIALQGRDILGSAQTGTGKTGAFGIPLVAQLTSCPQDVALVMTPTRELAAQVLQQLQALAGRDTNIASALLIGGESMHKQLKNLRSHPRLLVGTPGRINDHLTRGSLKLNNVTFLVLDETDRMLDMGFSIQIQQVIKHMPQKHQTLLFSATIPKNITKIAQKYLHNPVQIAVEGKSAPAENIEQEVLHLSNTERYSQFLKELETRKGSIIVFMKTKYSTEKMAKKLCKANHAAIAIHGDLQQHKRKRVIESFRHKKHRILVATDVAARGLDIPHIKHVINYDLPQCAEDYIHRIGRTARAGEKGASLCLVTPADKAKWKAIYKLLNPGDTSLDNDRRERNRKRPPRKSSSHPSSRGKRNRSANSNSDSPSSPKKSYTKKFKSAHSGSDTTASNKKKPYGKKFSSASRSGSDSVAAPKKPYGKKFKSARHGADKPRSAGAPSARKKRSARN